MSHRPDAPPLLPRADAPRAGRRRRLALLVAMALAAAAYVALPDGALPNVEHVVEDLARSVGPWTYVLVAVLAFLETAAFVGLVAPGELTLVVAGTVAAQGEVELLPLIAVGWLAAAAGDSAGFWLGRRLGRSTLERQLPRLGVPSRAVHAVEAYFRRRGGQAVLLGRWIGVVRSLAPFLAGASGMPYGRFLPWSVAGAGAWSAVFATLGFVFWQSFDEVLGRATQLSLGVAALVVALVTVRHVRRSRRRPPRATVVPMPARRRLAVASHLAEAPVTRAHSGNAA